MDRKRALFLAAANRYLLGDIGGGANGVMDMDEDLTIALDNQQLYNDLLATTNSVRAGLRVSSFLTKKVLLNNVFIVANRPNTKPKLVLFCTIPTLLP